MATKIYRVIMSLVKISAVKAYFIGGKHWIYSCTLHVYYLMWVKFSIRDLHKMLLSMHFMNSGTWKAVLLWWACVKLHLHWPWNHSILWKWRVPW